MKRFAIGHPAGAIPRKSTIPSCSPDSGDCFAAGERRSSEAASFFEGHTRASCRPVAQSSSASVFFSKPCSISLGRLGTGNWGYDSAR